jgi:hypothetical protein
MSTEDSCDNDSDWTPVQANIVVMISGLWNLWGSHKIEELGKEFCLIIDIMSCSLFKVITSTQQYILEDRTLLNYLCRISQILQEQTGLACNDITAFGIKSVTYMHIQTRTFLLVHNCRTP